MVEIAHRTSPLEGRGFEGDGISLSVAKPASRLSLRAPEGSLPALSEALGLELPQRPKSTSTKGNRAALWLGPDEWLVIDEDGADLMAICGKIPDLHSAVDTSHRNVAIEVSGARSADVLSAGCPQDLSLARFPVGASSRTVFGKVEIILWRRDEQTFHVECWRSFSAYGFDLLEAAAREAE
ncbi:sarcosine oxidase subunit gamma [Chelativorans sp. YIM 93263]|uniref:sarcosine oxidase subunit gamma n=1 Tax=Chelativorans sp. YIM 93263 TaxID=2906648 RepID=UPI0023790F62|nr:sarcosine oxidase subunit gamma [Chelativorans sp. YIM 93263]